jgi:transposase-like protein
MIEEYADTLEPSLSEQWHADEMAINVKGKWMWLWNVMDKDTRFMLTSLISEKRQIEDARKVFQKAKEVGKVVPKCKKCGKVIIRASIRKDEV